MMDELSFNNLGPQGRETVMIKYLRNAPERKLDEASSEKPEQAVITEKIEYDVRGLRENEAIEVSRCAYKTHGYTFFDSHIYYPDRLVEMNRTSEMVSAVAVTQDNVFMGHCAILYQYPEDTIAELTFAFVNVEFRGQGALNRLVDYLFNVTPKRELRGIYAFAVTNHIFTQKSMIKYQIKDCGIQLATSPSSWKFKGIEEIGHQRISVVLSFKYMMPPVSYELYVPEHHREMISKIYNNLGVTHKFVTPSTDLLQISSPETILRTGANELEGCAEIYIKAYGPDVLKQVRMTLRSFCLGQMSCINLFLGLKYPETYWLTTEFEKMGFFFSGILPETQIGDALNLQYLNNVEFDYGKIMLLSDISKEMLAYIQERDPNIIV
jgi:serine/threonine-protein kinase RsbW